MEPIVGDLYPSGHTSVPHHAIVVLVPKHIATQVDGGVAIFSNTTGKTWYVPWARLLARAVAEGIDLPDPKEPVVARTLNGVPGTPEKGDYEPGERLPTSPPERVAGYAGPET